MFDSTQLLFVPVAIVGRLGTLPLAAVGLSNLLFFFCTVFFSFLLVVTTPRVASAVANSKAQEVNTLTAPAASTEKCLGRSCNRSVA